MTATETRIDAVARRRQAIYSLLTNEMPRRCANTPERDTGKVGSDAL